MDSLANWLHYWAFPEGTPKAFLDSPLDNYPLARIRFVLSSPAAATFPKRLVRSMASYGWSPDESRNQVEFVLGMNGDVVLW